MPETASDHESVLASPDRRRFASVDRETVRGAKRRLESAAGRNRIDDTGKPKHVRPAQRARAYE
jgi:hypothetical protein